MNTMSLEEVQKLLAPYKFLLQNNETIISSSFDTIEPPERELMMQAGHDFIRQVCKEVKDTTSNNDGYLYQIYYAFAVRGCYEEDLEKIESLSDDDPQLSDLIKISIKAEFQASYLSKELIPSESLREFSEKNASHNIWPFWREFVQSTSLRIGMNPPIQLPFFNRPK